MQSSFTPKQLDRRAATIIRSVRTGQVSPRSDAIRELAEIHETLGDQPVKSAVVARLIVTRANGQRTIVEVHSNATFHDFFRFYRQSGRRRSTKTLVRTASRAEHLMSVYPEARVPGLAGIALRIQTMSPLYSESNPVVSAKLRIIRKRAYQHLLSVSPDQLGLTKTTARPPIYSTVPARAS